MILTRLAGRLEPRNTISGAAAAMIDSVMLINIMLIFAVAALVIHRPVGADQLPLQAAGAGSGTEYVEPAVTLRVSAEGTALIVNGQDTGPRPVGELARAFEAAGNDAGPIELCVARGVEYAIVLEVIRQVDRMVAKPTLLECRGETQ